MRVALGVALILGGLWVAFVLALLVAKPRGAGLGEMKRVVPDAVRLLRDLHADTSLPTGVRRWLRALLVYLAIPFDLVPDFIPVLGYADDVIIVALVLRRVVRLAGADALDRHWTGSPAGLAAIKRLAAL